MKNPPNALFNRLIAKYPEVFNKAQMVTKTHGNYLNIKLTKEESGNTSLSLILSELLRCHGGSRERGNDGDMVSIRLYNEK